MGGISSEREISLKSGEAIINNLDKDKYEIVSIVIDKKEDIINKVKGIDFALLALHGQFGEDGTVQSILQTMDIPYSGCGPLSSAWRYPCTMNIWASDSTRERPEPRSFP